MYITEEQLANDILKIAGAAGLAGMATDPNLDSGLRKEASDRMDSISYLNPALIGEEFVKVAFEIYDEPTIGEILEGHYIDSAFDKIASIVNLGNIDDQSLEKIAAENGSRPEAAKAVANELSDASSNVKAVIDNKKVVAESRPDGAVKAGGENVNNLEGYNPLLNPGEYDIETTANSHIEEALMLKQASYEAYLSADEVLRHYGVE